MFVGLSTFGSSNYVYAKPTPTDVKDLKRMPANVDKIAAKLKAQGVIPKGASEKEIQQIVNDYIKKQKIKKLK